MVNLLTKQNNKNERNEKLGFQVNKCNDISLISFTKQLHSHQLCYLFKMSESCSRITLHQPITHLFQVWCKKTRLTWSSWAEIM